MKKTAYSLDNLILIWTDMESTNVKSKPVEKQEWKVTGLNKIAGLPLRQTKPMDLNLTGICITFWTNCQKP